MGRMMGYSRLRALIGMGMLVVSLCAVPAAAWSTKEHILLTRIAAMRLIHDPTTPPEMVKWLKSAAPDAIDMESEKRYFLTARNGIVPRNADGLSYWAVIPDLKAYIDGQHSKVAPFGVHERLLHYIDIEFFNPDESLRIYRHDLSTRPGIEDIPRDMTDARYQRAGMLPFRIEQAYGELVKSIREGRLEDMPGRYPRDEHATRWAGMLAHYLEDNTQPQHATVDYKSQSYFADKRRAPSIHAQMEYIMVDDEHDDYMDLREKMWPMLVQALDEVEVGNVSDDLWISTIEISLRSYDHLPLIGLAAMHAGGQGGTPDRPVGAVGEVKFDTRAFFNFTTEIDGRPVGVMRMKAEQLALAVRRVEQVWRKAWDEATSANQADEAAPGD